MATIQARFRVHRELNDFLAPGRRWTAFEHPVGETDTLKHVLESLGIPHTEIAHIAVNGITVPHSESAREGTLIEAWPHVPPVAMPAKRFVLDGHLGRLAAYLRMLGFDCWYERTADDAALARVSSEQQRVLLTRDVGLLKRKEVEFGCFVRSDRPHDQLRAVTFRYGLGPSIAPFTRCMSCNGVLVRVAKCDVAERLPPHTRETKEDFSQCMECGKIYWKGSHHARMLGWVAQLTHGSG